MVQQLTGEKIKVGGNYNLDESNCCPAHIHEDTYLSKEYSCRASTRGQNTAI